MSKTQTQAITSLLDWAAAKKGRAWEIRSFSEQDIEIELSDGVRHIRRFVTGQRFRDAALDVLDLDVEYCIDALAQMRLPPSGAERLREHGAKDGEK